MPNFAGEFDVLQMPDFVGVIDPGPGRTSPESAAILEMQDFLVTLIQGPGLKSPTKSGTANLSPDSNAEAGPPTKQHYLH